MSNEINGFEILDYNIHGIPVKAKTSTCPKCSEHRKPQNKKQKCMSVFWDTGLGQCNHCGETVQMHTYKKKSDNFTRNYIKPKQKPKSNLSQIVIDWFKNERGISEQTLIDCKISEGNRWMPKANKSIHTIEFNYYLFGELINYKSRGKNKDFMFEKDCELILYGIDDIISQKEAVLVEGEPDKLAFWECGVKNCASVPNGFTLPRPDGTSTISTNYLDDYFGVLEPIEKFYLAFDNDTAGIEGQKEFIRRLGAEKCYLVDFKDCKDANDYLKEYGKEALKQTLADAKQVPLEEVITLKDVERDLDDFWINGAPKGMTIDLQGFDDVASFVFKQYSLLVSAPGSGKSDLIDFITVKLNLKYGFKVGICSTENKPIYFHHDKLFRKIHGLRPNKDNIALNSVIEVKNHINTNFFHVEKSSRYFLEDVLSKFAELVKRKNVRLFVLDPFNKINLREFSKNNINDYTAEYHQKIDEFCIKYDAHVFLVLHPKKLPLKEGSNKTFIMPTAYDSKGGGEHYDMSYNIIGMVRDYERECVQIRTLKWKFQHLGTAGVDNWYGWNINNGRYTPTDYHFDESSSEIPAFTWDNSNWLGKSFDEPKKEEPKPIPMIDPKDAFQVDTDDIDDVPF